MVGNNCPAGNTNGGGPDIKLSGRLVGGIIHAGKGVGPSFGLPSLGLSTNSNPFSPSSCGFNILNNNVFVEDNSDWLIISKSKDIV